MVLTNLLLGAKYMQRKLNSIITYLLVTLFSSTFLIQCDSTPSKSSTTESYGEWRTEDNSVGWIPSWVINEDGSREKALEKKIWANLKNPSFYNLRDQGLFNRKLLNAKTEDLPWSSGFFPSFFDGIAGRWAKGFWSQLSGYDLKSESKIKSILESNDRDSIKWLFKISPMEKYDIMVGDYTFGATRRELAIRGHKDLFMAAWAGYCNGVSVASVMKKEPFRSVNIVNPNGHKITFHPYDIKALLGLAYYKVNYRHYRRLGNRCKEQIHNPDPFFDVTRSNDDGFLYKRSSDKRCRGVNPATLVMALQNRLGIAKRTFVIDKMQGKKVSNHPIGDARIDIVKGPYPVTRYKDKFVATGTTSLLDVEIKMWLGSTALDDDDGVNEAINKSIGLYEKVGFHMERGDSPKTYYATLELDVAGKIIGGEWGHFDRWGEFTASNESPDFAWFGREPLLIDQKQTKDILGLEDDELEEAVEFNKTVRCKADRGDTCNSLAANPQVKWHLVKALYKRSIKTLEESPKTPTIYMKW